MAEKMKQFFRKQKWNIAVLIFVAIVGSFYISQKEGYHMDELLSFELANAEFTPWIVTTQPEGRLEKFVQNEIYGDTVWETWGNFFATVKDVIVHRGESKLLSYTADVYEEPVWITAQQFREYITVGERDDFNYLSVYFNVKDDNHPPLHFMAVHTISSIFKGEIIPWMGCVINLMLVLGICVILMKISKEFFGSEKLGILSCLLYGCSMAGIATVLLIRMYAMLTFWCMLALYMHMRKMQSGEWEKHNKWLIFVTVCGFFTQYYFVIFMIFLAAATLILMKEKRLYYVRTMGISAVIGLCIYPFSVLHVLYSGRGVESVQNLGGGLAGFGERCYYFGNIVKEEVLGGTFGVVTLLILLIGLIVLGHKRGDKLRISGFLWLMVTSCIGYLLVAVKIAPFYADRYLMPVFPLLACFLALIVWKLLPNMWAFLICLLLLLPNMIGTTPAYLYQGYDAQVDVAKQWNIPCVCVYHGVGYYQNLIEFMHYPQTLMVTEEQLTTRSQDVVLDENAEIVVLLEQGVDEDTVYQYLKDSYGFSVQEILLEKGVHGDKIVRCRK